MPYHKDKQQAFQAAQQAVAQAHDAAKVMDVNSGEYGHHVKRLQEEIGEAEQIILKALTNCTEHQHEQLTQFQQEIDSLKQQIGEEYS